MILSISNIANLPIILILSILGSILLICNIMFIIIKILYGFFKLKPKCKKMQFLCMLFTFSYKEIIFLSLWENKKSYLSDMIPKNIYSRLNNEMESHINHVDKVVKIINTNIITDKEIKHQIVDQIHTYRDIVKMFLHRGIIIRNPTSDEVLIINSLMQKNIINNILLEEYSTYTLTHYYRSFFNENN